jgi:hypothetical protein
MKLRFEILICCRSSLNRSSSSWETWSAAYFPKCLSFAERSGAALSLLSVQNSSNVLSQSFTL